MTFGVNQRAGDCGWIDCGKCTAEGRIQFGGKLIFISRTYTDIGEHNLAGTAGVCVDSCYNLFRGIVCEGARTLRTCIGFA